MSRADSGRGWRCTDVLAEVTFLCPCPCHPRNPSLHAPHKCACGGPPVLAERLGMSRDALVKALQRARKRRPPLKGLATGLATEASR